MSANRVEWRIAGDEVANCNCDWGCPCQFNANPTAGNCEALIAWQIHEGHFGDVSLDGVKFARIYHWPGPIHEGNGSRQTIVDESASDEQRAAIDTLDSGEHGGPYWEIFASVCPDRHETATAPIELEVDRERRIASYRIGGIGHASVEPIKNPVSGEEHRARIELPSGFEYKQAEVANTVSARASGEGPLAFTLENTYAQLNAFDWSGG